MGMLTKQGAMITGRVITITTITAIITTAKVTRSLSRSRRGNRQVPSQPPVSARLRSLATADSSLLQSASARGSRRSQSCPWTAPSKPSLRTLASSARRRCRSTRHCSGGCSPRMCAHLTTYLGDRPPTSTVTLSKVERRPFQKGILLTRRAHSSPPRRDLQGRHGTQSPSAS